MYRGEYTWQQVVPLTVKSQYAGKGSRKNETYVLKKLYNWSETVVITLIFTVCYVFISIYSLRGFVNMQVQLFTFSQMDS